MTVDYPHTHHTCLLETPVTKKEAWWIRTPQKGRPSLVPGKAS
jgi:hypothetical protein